MAGVWGGQPSTISTNESRFSLLTVSCELSPAAGSGCYALRHRRATDFLPPPGKRLGSAAKALLDSGDFDWVRGARPGGSRRRGRRLHGAIGVTKDRTDPAPLVERENDVRLERTHAWLSVKKKAIEADLSVHAAEIGEYLIETFFDGDVALACSHNPHKENSLRKLCEHDDAPFSLSALRTFIQVAQNFRVIPHEQASRLPPSHHALLYRVANPRERAALARKCAEDRTSARRLRELVKGRGRRRPGAGRKPQAPNVKELRSLTSRIDKIIDKLDRLEASDVDAMIEQARELRSKVAELLDRLGDRRARNP